MGRSGHIDVVSRYHAYMKACEKYANEQFAKEDLITLKEIAKYQNAEITRIFNEVINEFYSSYTPALYDRQYGLYDLLDLPSDSQYFTYDSIDDLVNPDKLHGDRSGGSLYHKIFEEGWHGGAESGPKHPSPGTPRYRIPPPNYPRWGRIAKQTTPPYDRFYDELANAETSYLIDRITEISVEHNDIVVNRVNEYMKEVYPQYMVAV